MYKQLLVQQFWCFQSVYVLQTLVQLSSKILRRTMSIAQFMVPKSGKAAAGSNKRTLTAADGAQQQSPVSKASKPQQGRSWVDWQLYHRGSQECGAASAVEPSTSLVANSVPPHRHSQPGNSTQAYAESLLADLLAEDSWRKLIDVERKKPYYSQLEAFVKKELDTKTVYPPRQQIFRALNELPVSKVKVVIIGQVCCLSSG